MCRVIVLRSASVVNTDVGVVKGYRRVSVKCVERICHLGHDILLPHVSHGPEALEKGGRDLVHLEVRML
jgi:hypothetical protein